MRSLMHWQPSYATCDVKRHVRKSPTSRPMRRDFSLRRFLIMSRWVCDVKCDVIIISRRNITGPLFASAKPGVDLPSDRVAVGHAHQHAVLHPRTDDLARLLLRLARRVTPDHLPGRALLGTGRVGVKLPVPQTGMDHVEDGV